MFTLFISHIHYLQLWPFTDTVSAFLYKLLSPDPSSTFSLSFHGQICIKCICLHQLLSRGMGLPRPVWASQDLLLGLGKGSPQMESSCATKRKRGVLLVRHQIVSAMFPRLWHANPAVSRDVSKWCAVRTESTLLWSNKFGKCFMLYTSLRNSQYILTKTLRNLL